MTSALGGWLLHLVLRVLAATWRVRVVGAAHLQGARRDGDGFVYALWHGALVPLLWYHRGQGVTLLVSQHADGDLLTHAARPLGYAIVRGSSTRGGVRGLRAAVRVLRAGGAVAITPDGPRGPAGVVKPGALVAGRHAGVGIVPVAAAASRVWTVGSWDALIVPRPFARVTVVYGPMLRPAARTIPAAAADLAGRLDAASRDARAATAA